MHRWLSVLALVVPTLLLAGEADAVPSSARATERPLEAATGARGRLVRVTQANAPAARAAAWKAFTAQHGSWQASWDSASAVPARIWGEGIAAPGASADPAIAAAAARAILDEQLALLAPGTKRDAWVLDANLTHGRGGALRTVSFVQQVDGVPVLGAGVSVLFKRDRAIVLASSAQPGINLRAPAVAIAPDRLTAAAVDWLTATYGATPTVRSIGELVIVPIPREATDGAPTIEYHVARTVQVELTSPRGRWDVYVDATTGAAVARVQRLLFGTGTLTYNTPVRYPSGARQDFPAAYATLTVGVTDAAGQFTFTAPSPFSFFTNLVGPRVQVVNASGPTATTSLSVSDGGTANWSAPNNEEVDAQLTGFIHANRVKDLALTELNPSLPWLATAMEVIVNEGGSCNAYSDGDAIHFLMSSRSCENTARIPDVIYHEFSHSLHLQSIMSGAGATDVALSEGTADYLAATITGDPGVGRGVLLGSTEPGRDLDPVGIERQWPRDIGSDPHDTGLIIGGALWDLRTALIARLGATAGKRQADDLYYAILQRAADIPTAYPEVLAADDDDGNLANGTPNRCAIDAAFAPHGLVDSSASFGVHAPVRTGFQFDLEVSALAGCSAPAVSGVTFEWRLGDGTLTSVAMSATSDGFTTTIAAQPEGSVVSYRAIVRLASGATLSYPDNPGDPFYQFYVGDLMPVYCTDFEADPFAAGWTHAATSAADDWHWDVPQGDLANGDPIAAASGTHVVGTDLRTNGQYERNSVETLTSPTIDVNGYTGVRLQFKRWLGVEDGFYDQASIAADGAVVWRNFASANQDAQTHSLDREWRTVDVDLAAAAADGSVRVEFKLASDEGLQFGGWNIDDFCIMARGTGPRVPVCGNSVMETGESCDDGNTTAGDGCSELCVAEDPPPDDGGCCSTGADPRGALLLGAGSAALLVRRRRKARA